MHSMNIQKKTGFRWAWKEKNGLHFSFRKCFGNEAKYLELTFTMMCNYRNLN